METVSKFEASEAQLTTAIKLFFEDGNAIAIHTLARASEEILDKLCAKKNLPRGIMHEGLASIKPEFHRKIIKEVNKSKNFFKHADMDIDEILSWNPRVSEYFIWDAVCLHRRLVGMGKVAEFTIFSLWFRLNHDDLWIEDGKGSIDVILPDARRELGHLSKAEFFHLTMEAWTQGKFNI